MSLFSSGTLFTNNLTIDTTQIVLNAGTNLSKSGQTMSVISNPTFSGITNITNTTEATNTTSGSLILGGGIGVAKKLFVGSTIEGTKMKLDIVSSNPKLSFKTVGNEISVEDYNEESVVKIDNDGLTGNSTFYSGLESTSSTDGSVVLVGGLGVGKRINCNSTVLSQNPSFVAGLSGNYTNTGLGSFIKVPYTNVSTNGGFQKGGTNFDTSTNTFTVPVAGMYAFNVRALFTPNVATTDFIVRLRFTNAGYAGNDFRVFQQVYSSNTTQQSFSGTCIVYLPVNAAISVEMFNNGGNVALGGSLEFTLFSGTLIN